MSVRSSITPGLAYEDAPGAIDFLCRAFGFARQIVVPGAEPGQIAHAQLTLGDCMVMLGSATAATRARFNMVSPAAHGGVVTATLYVTLDDPDAHHARAVSEGARVINPPHDNDFGGRGYEVRDTEGNVWIFGSYDPWSAAD